MLGIFVKPTEDHKERQYKTAYLKLPDGSMQPFKYYQLERNEMNKYNFISNIDFQTNSILIRTTSPLEFTVKSKIIIDGIQHTVNYYYEDNQLTNNGPFISRKLVVFKYLSIIH